MKRALYGIYALIVFGPEISLIRSAHSFDDSDTPPPPPVNNIQCHTIKLKLINKIINSKLLNVYSQTLLFRSPKGNGKKFEIAGVSK